jgi:hypothetical protein
MMCMWYTKHQPNRVLQGVELWHKRLFVIGTGLAKFNVQSKPIAETTPLVSIEP